MIVRGSKMAKDKSINEFMLNWTAAGSTASGDISINPQGAIGVGGVTRPLTVSGLRWNIGFGRVGSATTRHLYKWVIWVRRKGQAVPAVPVAASGTIADAFASIDENNILVWGAALSSNAADNSEFDGATKTQRKLAVGDQLVFSWAVQTGTGATDPGSFYGIVQTFYKS